MAWVSAPDAPRGMRWFRERAPEREYEGVWHLGPRMRLGVNWPAGPGICGFAPAALTPGRHETALSVSGDERAFCPTCLAGCRRT